MKIILALIFIGRAISNYGLIGGFTTQSQCSSSLIGSPVNFFTAEISSINNFFKDNSNKLQLMHFETQVVAGINYKAVFKMTSNGQAQWVGVLAFNGLDGKLSITSFVQTFDLADVWVVLKKEPVEESKLSPVDCPNIFEDFGKDSSSKQESDHSSNDSATSPSQDSSSDTEADKSANRDYSTVSEDRKIETKSIIIEDSENNSWSQSKQSREQVDSRARGKGKTRSKSSVGGFKGPSGQFDAATFGFKPVKWNLINVGSSFEQE